MEDKKDSTNVSDIPSVAEAKALLRGFKAFGNVLCIVLCIFERLGIRPEQMKELQRKIDDVTKDADILDLHSRFNAAFRERGWIAVGRALSVTVIKGALEYHEVGKDDEAEELLVEWFTEEHIRFFAIAQARPFHKAMRRNDQLEEALRLYLEERYLAAIPLILIACDGFASDVGSVSPFEKDADLSCFDSITGHSDALPALIKLVTKGVRKSRDDEMDLPLRHGILHGRSLGYANKIVCAKAWLLMMAFVDWAKDKASEAKRKREYEENRAKTPIDGVKMLKKNRAIKIAMEAFEPHEIVGPLEGPFASNGPELAVIEFLSGWKAKNYGKMGKVAWNEENEPYKMMAGKMRNMTELVELLGYEIKSIRYSTIVRCDVRICATVKTWKTEVKGNIDLFLLKVTTSGNLAMQDNEEFRWVVQPNFVYDIVNGKFAKDT